MTLKIHSPAKINMGLKIKGRREDGYHDLESIFVPITLCDEMGITESSRDDVTFLVGNKILNIKPNTVELALLHLRKKSPSLPFFEIKIKKNIPMGAGLGGGSSNAGSLLSFLEKKYKLKIDQKELLLMASKIGADVPFFLNPKTSYVSGLGEKIHPMPSSQKLSMVLVKPSFSVSTKEAFQWYDAQTPLTPDIKNDSSPLEVNLGLSNFLNFLQNDLESVVIKRWPEIEEIKKALVASGALGSLMTGSGSAVFGVFRNRADGEAATDLLKRNSSPDNSIFYVESMI